MINAVANSLSEQGQQSEPALQLQPERLVAEQFMHSTTSPNQTHSSGAASNCLSQLPAVEHALAYEVLSNGVRALCFTLCTVFNIQ